MTAAFYNAFFTSLPIGGFALFDRPLRRFTTLEAHPAAYNRRPPLTAGAFWKTGVATAIIHALVTACAERSLAVLLLWLNGLPQRGICNRACCVAWLLMYLPCPSMSSLLLLR